MHQAQDSVTLTAGEYAAEISPRGARLLTLTHRGEDLVVPADQGEDGYPGCVLAPWPNRIAGAAYAVDDTAYELAVTEESTGAALHGLITELDFTVAHQGDDAVELSARLEASAGYPWTLDLVLRAHVLREAGLSITLMARQPVAADETAEVVSDDVESAEGAESAGEAADADASGEEVAAETADAPAGAPFGAGFHPYLRAGAAPLDECRLNLPASTVLRTEPDGAVTGREPVSGDLDLTSGPLLTGRTIDHAYTDLPTEAWIAELTHGPSGLVVRLIADTPWAQVFTGDSIDRAGVAVEPMTCPPDAFNSDEDLARLTPGEWFRVGYSIEALRAD
ncbi:putative aldose-1-epimerase [Nesterenkonia sp. F]|uniref:aldose epimerase family protein n=1 Tax=Nesterenkonia sp. F TaxID=795955 RepID=UPI000255D246|nr:putative aldose-1-epimerase [Nesterenkonia sp. F]